MGFNACQKVVCPSWSNSSHSRVRGWFCRRVGIFIWNDWRESYSIPSERSTGDIQSGDTVKTFSEDYKTVTTVYDNGNQLVKTFSDDMKTITSVLKDADGTVIVTETKTFSEDGLTISTDVVYG